MNLARILTDGAAVHGGRPALWFDGRRALVRRSRPACSRRGARAARARRRRRRSRRDQAAELARVRRRVLRCVAARGVAVPLNVLLAPPEVEERVASVDAAVLVTRSCRAIGDPPAMSSPARRRTGRDPVHVRHVGAAERRDADARQHPGRARMRPTRWRSLGRRRPRSGAVLARARAVDRHRLHTLAGAAVAVVGRFDAEQTFELMTAADDGPARRADDVHRVLRGRTGRRAAAAGADRACRRRRRPGRGRRYFERSSERTSTRVTG